IVIQRRVEDLQLGVESYQKRLNLTKPDTYRSDLKRREAYTAYSNPRGFIYQNKDNKNILMRIDELHKFKEGHHLRFLHLYIYDTRDELRNRTHHFGGLDESALNSEIIKGLIHVLDEHNGLVKLFRTARDRYNTGDIPSFKIRLYNKGGIRGYELPTSDVLRAIVFENGPRSHTDFDVIIELRGGPHQRINKLHQSYINQNNLRLDFLSGLYDAISRGDRNGIAAYSKIMLPNTFTGGPRGLPHCHTLLWIESKNTLKDVTQIDEYISAEIPDPVQNPRGNKLVTRLMMHGPCGSANLDASCMQNGPCNKHFPKQYNEQTYFDSNGHTQYRIRDTRIYVMKGESRLDNCNVVPYNQALCLAFEAHVNVKYYGWSMLIKYLFKYISKGPYRILAKISKLEMSTSAVGTNKQIDEIQNYVDGRFICPFKACWRIFDFSIQCRELAVQILNVHLEDMQSINFHERDRLGIDIC
nr:DNA helicase [Tanacetum cinerariifolium]